VLNDKKTGEAIAYVLGFKEGWTVMIIETPRGFFLRLKHGDKRINFQLDYLSLLEVAEKIKRKVKAFESQL